VLPPLAAAIKLLMASNFVEEKGISHQHLAKAHRNIAIIVPHLWMRFLGLWRPSS
jgi:hypothetical protein